ncbi:Rha family transcriptional regulator [Clostridium botulinum]|uniref:Rha family transcriptional regulator n=1 Tax=Clostridium botulinum TaxID=1491 RepID=UPI001FB09B73|nr:Rha family transcriptional regulator [Clostridium botulinum]
MNKSKNSFTPEKKLETIEKIIGLIQTEYEDTIQEFKTINCTGLLMRSVLYDAVKVANERFTEEGITQNLIAYGVQKQINEGDGKMNNLQIINQQGKLVIDSREVAEIVEKNHAHLMRDIRGYVDVIRTNPKLDSLKFFLDSNYEDSKGETRPCYLLTKQGCEMVANKMTGQKGVLFTAEYVEAFNNMEKYTQTNFSINEFKGQLATLVNDMFEEKLSDVKEYYKIKAQSKVDISSYIKKRLGILRADDEYEQVKTRVFLILGINKWEDLDVDSYKTILPVIDESIRVIKLDRPQQTSFFDIA